MESIVDSIDNAYQEFVDEISSFLEAKQQAKGSGSSGLESLAHKWEAFKHACDQAEDFVNHEKHRIACKCTVDKVTAETINGCEFAKDESATAFQGPKLVENDDDDKLGQGLDE